jgi:hypothetical protein
MLKNRVFKPASQLPVPLDHCVTDATRTAQAVGISIQLHVETNLLRWYFIPDDPDDDGRALVREMLEQLDLVLAGKVKAMRVSYGEWLMVRFELAAQHRRRALPTILTLQAILGPCTADAILLYVVRAMFPLSENELS